MKKLNKKQTAELEELRTAITDAAIAYNEAREALESFRQERLDEMGAWADERSENWQDSDNGQAHEAWRSEWETEPCEEVTEDVTDYPTEMEG